MRIAIHEPIWPCTDDSPVTSTAVENEKGDTDARPADQHSPHEHAGIARRSDLGLVAGRSGDMRMNVVGAGWSAGAPATDTTIDDAVPEAAQRPV